jgi:quinoprotein glucose dehydrogenase
VKGPRGLPLFKPPYSSITAYDMNRGEKLWTIPHGDGPRDHPALRDLKLPQLGSLEKPGGPLLTKTLLFLGQGLVSSKFRAFDKRTGQSSTCPPSHLPRRSPTCWEQAVHRDRRRWRH